MFRILLSLTVLMAGSAFCKGYNILVIMPHSSPSHFATFEPYFLRLCDRGHNLTVVSYFHANNLPISYHPVSLQHFSTNRIADISFLSNASVPLYINLKFLYITSRTVKKILASRDVKNAVFGTKYDLVILEAFSTRMFLSVPYKLQVPFILLSSTVVFPFHANNLGVPINPAYVPSTLGFNSDQMTFYERLCHSLNVLINILAFDYLFENAAYDAATELMGPLPSLKSIEKNASIVLVNTHFSYNRPRPLPPNIIEVGGLRVSDAGMLPMDIEKFINESEHGVVYFCMGSLLQGSSFPPEKRDAFLKAFSRIKQRVLWKWEGELPGKSDNIMTAKWMPQRDILAHKNVKLFISHGGLLGTSEAVYEAVPIIGIPIFGDQRTNVRSIEAAGAGELLDYNEISEDVVYEKIQKVLNNPSYRENAKELSRRYKDRPMSPMDTAVYWTEYVIRHKGAYHLRSAAVDLSWYQYLLLDVIAVVLLAAVIVIVALYLTVKFILKSIARILGLSSKPVIKKAKVN